MRMRRLWQGPWLAADTFMGGEAASPWGLSDDEAEGPPGPPPLPSPPPEEPPPPLGVQPDADAPAASRGRRRPRDDENIAYITVAGGVLVYDIRQSILSAHCTLPEHADRANPCRVRRTCMPGRNDGQGRPCGFLMAWLADAGRHADRASHGQAARRLNDADRAALSHERRSAGRAELVAGASPALDFERPPRDGEPEESLQIPWR